MSELEINDLGAQQRRFLELIWERGGATVQELLEALNASSDSAPLAYTTVLTTLQKLEKAGWLYHETAEEHGRAYVYKPTKKRNEAIGDSLRSFARTFLDGSKTLLFQHFVEDTGLSDQEWEEIRTMIDKRRKGKKQ